MKRAMIVDDESNAREALRLMLEIYCPEIEVVTEAGSAKEALTELKIHGPEIVFLDIQMPGMNGFEFLQQAENRDFQTIITTAYDRYAMKAIKYSAIDFLLKPIRIDELKGAVSKAISLDNPKDYRLEVFLEHYKSNFHKRLVIPHRGGYDLVNFIEIIRAQADRNYTQIFLANGERVLASRTLKQYDEILTPEGFMRVHHSHLINMNLIKNYEKESAQITMVDGSTVEVARSKKSEFLNRMLRKYDP